jgi:predicted nucleic-acid-binding Zn-ribbon protein
MSHQAKCALCGGTNLEPGHLHTTGKVNFRPSHSKFFTLHTADVAISAEVCMDCGHVQLLADIKKLATLRNPAHAATAVPAAV